MSRFENRRWLVIPTSIVDDIDFNQVHESSLDSLRKSLDDTQTFIKYDVVVVEETRTETYEDPETQEELSNTILAGIYGRPTIYSDEYTEYNHSEILELLSTEVWSLNEIEE
jgi:hypothetical protein|tara:strand:- start:2079 stop:2414 length:336 start_codon:yes stop_codon:yes gene_type:complete